MLLWIHCHTSCSFLVPHVTRSVSALPPCGHRTTCNIALNIFCTNWFTLCWLIFYTPGKSVFYLKTQRSRPKPWKEKVNVSKCVSHRLFKNQQQQLFNAELMWKLDVIFWASTASLVKIYFCDELSFRWLGITWAIWGIECPLVSALIQSERIRWNGCGATCNYATCFLIRSETCWAGRTLCSDATFRIKFIINPNITCVQCPQELIFNQEVKESYCSMALSVWVVLFCIVRRWRCVTVWTASLSLCGEMRTGRSSFCIFYLQFELLKHLNLLWRFNVFMISTFCFLCLTPSAALFCSVSTFHIPAVTTIITLALALFGTNFLPTAVSCLF